MMCFKCLTEYKAGPIGPKEGVTQYKGTVLCRYHSFQALLDERREMTLPPQVPAPKKARPQ